MLLMTAELTDMLELACEFMAFAKFSIDAFRLSGSRNGDQKMSQI